jgi:hypothetical protein
MYNQKFYSAQNFMLPFFRKNIVYTTVPNDKIQDESFPDRFYVPRSTRSLFNDTSSTTCGQSGVCRVANIPSPPLDKLLINHWRNLVFEVYDVE